MISLYFWKSPQGPKVWQHTRICGKMVTVFLRAQYPAAPPPPHLLPAYGPYRRMVGLLTGFAASSGEMDICYPAA